MQDFNIMIFINAVSTIIFVLLAYFLFSLKSSNGISNKLFGVFLMLFAIDISGSYIELFFGEIPEFTTNLRAFTPSIQVPIFYLYFLSVCYSDFKLQKKHLLHLIPYLTFNTLFIPKSIFLNNINWWVLSNGFVEDNKIIVLHILFHIQIIVYAVACFFVLRRAKKVFTENYSGNQITIYQWLFQLLISYNIFCLLALLKNVLKFTDYEDQYRFSKIIISLSILILICWYVLKALKNPDLFKGVNSKILLANNLTQTVDYNIDKKTIDILRNYMSKEEPYLNPSLTIKNLAQKLQLPMRNLSILINRELDLHFFDFVNEYRIKKATDILKDSSKDKLTILEILYEVGFNSKSSFNTAFKKHTGKTPTQYRNSLKN